MSSTTVIEEPLVRFGREVCGDIEAGLRREWLVTNGIGGFACGTLAGPATRRYQGLLVASLHPPVDRMVLVGGLDEWATYDGQRYPLSAHDFEGTITPQGFEHIQSFALEGLTPCWTFALGDALLERRIWMEHGENTTFVAYRLVRARGPVELQITPLTCARDFHSLGRGGDWTPAIMPAAPGDIRIGFAGAPTLHAGCDGGEWSGEAGWWWGFGYREEHARGLDGAGDLFAPGTLQVTLKPGEERTLVFSTAGERPDVAEAACRERERQSALINAAKAEASSPLVQQLVLAADQFLVTRASGEPTVIAGYPWFNDWGRDTFIALPGLCLATGRADEAAATIRSFARFVRDGLVPNNFPDREGDERGYNTADATLWWVLAARAYEDATGDASLVDELLPAFESVVDAHIRGTRYGIGVDPADGLLRAGEPGVQLTWMDAKVGDFVVTPRMGKPVEINALWYNVLRSLERWVGVRGRDASPYAALAERCRESFRARFVPPGGGSLADVVDGPDGDDWTARPNQLFALSLPEPLLEGDAALTAFEAVSAQLLTSYGLRSHAAGDDAYRAVYEGGVWERDTAYHQGTAWAWLIGPYIEAYLRIGGSIVRGILIRSSPLKSRMST